MHGLATQEVVSSRGHPLGARPPAAVRCCGWSMRGAGFDRRGHVGLRAATVLVGSWQNAGSSANTGARQQTGNSAAGVPHATHAFLASCTRCCLADRFCQEPWTLRALALTSVSRNICGSQPAPSCHVAKCQRRATARQT